MAGLDELMNMEGVVAAGRFTNDGQLQEMRGELPEQVAGGAAQFCGTVNMLFQTMSGAFEQMSGMQWTPAQGWAFSGGEYTVCVGGNVGVFVETDKADFNALFNALMS